MLKNKKKAVKDMLKDNIVDDGGKMKLARFT